MGRIGLHVRIIVMRYWRDVVGGAPMAGRRAIL
jgi:hypothetical protein